MSGHKKESREEQADYQVTWGGKLFYSVLIAVLVFFWWFVIYSHGVTPTH